MYQQLGLPVTLTWDSEDNFDFIKLRRKGEGESGDRSTANLLRDVAVKENRVGGQWLRKNVVVISLNMLYVCYG